MTAENGPIVNKDNLEKMTILFHLFISFLNMRAETLKNNHFETEEVFILVVCS